MYSWFYILCTSIYKDLPHSFQTWSRLSFHWTLSAHRFTTSFSDLWWLLCIISFIIKLILQIISISWVNSYPFVLWLCYLFISEMAIHRQNRTWDSQRKMMAWWSVKFSSDLNNHLCFAFKDRKMITCTLRPHVNDTKNRNN